MDNKIPGALDLNDGSFGSRKFLMAIFGLLLLTLTSLASIRYPAVAGILPTFVGGLLGVLSLYYGGNIANKFVIGKNIKGLPDGTTEPSDPEDTEKDPEPAKK